MANLKELSDSELSAYLIAAVHRLKTVRYTSLWFAFVYLLCFGLSTLIMLLAVPAFVCLFCAVITALFCWKWERSVLAMKFETMRRHIYAARGRKGECEKGQRYPSEGVSSVGPGLGEGVSSIRRGSCFMC